MLYLTQEINFKIKKSTPIRNLTVEALDSQQVMKNMSHLTREINFKIKKEHPDTRFACRGTRLAEDKGFEPSRRVSDLLP